jgi:serine-type D-Ala-D-Ala carboxypeptidase/endopeptidase (penicillin-binding protein 4)
MMRVLATATAAAAFVSGITVAGVSLFRDPSASRKPSATIGATPVLSVRRLPSLLADNVGSATLTRNLSAALERNELTGVDERSCVFAELVTPSVVGRPLVSRATTRSVIPASTLKVLTANAALSVLDPNERFTTTVRSTASVSAGTIAGDLWIVGGGDPLLESEAYTRTRKHPPGTATSLDKLADDVVAAGVQQITGKIVGDDRLFDDIRILPTWKKTYVSQGEVGPMGGLIIDDNFTLLDSRNRPIAATDVPTNAAQAFQRLLEARGVVVDGEAASAAKGTPEATTAAPVAIASIESSPVASLVGQMLSESDNMTAEALLKHIGLRSTGTGSTAAGASAVARSLWLNGATEASRQVVRVVDGSGLDRGDRLSCAALVDVLRSSPPNGALVSGFAVMGQSGTLKARLRDSPATGRVRAKTGSLNGVSALTGLADTIDGRKIRFAVVLNGLPSTALGVNLGNDFSEWLVGFGPGAVGGSLAPKE